MLIYLLLGASLVIINQYAITYFCLKYENVITNYKAVIEKQIVITSDSQLYVMILKHRNILYFH